MNGRMAGYALLIGALIGLMGWLEYYPSSPIFSALGLPGPAANTHRDCGVMYRQVSHNGRIPTRELVCRGPSRIGDLLEKQDVTLDAFSRRISYAQRIWAVADSAAWQRARDSVATAMVRIGGHEFSCWKNPNEPLLNIRATRFWKFPAYSVRFIAYRMQDDTRISPWLLQLDGYAKLPPECVYNPWRHG